MKTNYCLTLLDNRDEIVGVYGVFEKREDLYNYLGLIINKSYNAITVNYLEYYDVEFDTFIDWVKRVIKKDKIMCIYTCCDKVYRIVVREKI